MEVLCTQVDSLNWEIQCLNAENQKLRQRDQMAIKQVDYEAKLKRVKADIMEMMGRESMLENQLIDSIKVAEDARCRVSEAEERAARLQQRLEELLTAQEMPEALRVVRIAEGTS